MTQKQGPKVSLKAPIAEIVEEHGKSEIKVLVEPFYVTFKDNIDAPSRRQG